MTDEQMQYLQRLLAYQLKGIMFHSDMSILYHLFGMKEWCNIHYRRMKDESKAYVKLNAEIIDTYSQVVRPEVDNTRIRISNQLIRNKVGKQEAEYYHKEILETWGKWEKTYHDFLESGLEIVPEMSFLRTNLKSTRAELNKIKRLERYS